MGDPVCGPMSACCQLPDLARFLVILRSSHSQDLWHLLSPCCLGTSSFLILSLLNERSSRGCTKSLLEPGCIDELFRPGKRLKKPMETQQWEMASLAFSYSL